MCAPSFIIEDDESWLSYCHAISRKIPLIAYSPSTKTSSLKVLSISGFVLVDKSRLFNPITAPLCRLDDQLAPAPGC